jgi:hypothetical protein
MSKKKIKFEHYFNELKKFWNWVWNSDSILSYIVCFGFAFIIIKFILFPFFGVVLQNDYPIVVVVSGSMEHKIVKTGSSYEICGNYFGIENKKSLNFNEWWEICGNYYVNNFNLTKKEFKEFEFLNGLNIGDILVLWGNEPENFNVGDLLVFIPQDKSFFENYGPVIHRIVKIYDENGEVYFRTKGDHNSISAVGFENKIKKEDVIGSPILRIPYLGYIKLGLYKLFSIFN